MDELQAALAAEKDERKRAKLEKKISKMAKFLSKMELKKASPEKEPKKEKKRIEFAEAESIPEGELKKVEKLSGQFNPKSVENGWFSWWNKQGFFRPEYAGKVSLGKTFFMPLPPPNVTGSLHIGHAMMASIQDTLVRFKRMQGYSTLYLPGTDHAGIATQVVVEKALEKKSLYRKDMTREKFLDHVWEWKRQYGSRIVEQFKSLGTSLDFSREKFTMDENLSEAVTEAFVRFYEEGLIYRGNRLVNWCAKIQTSLSDLEVDYRPIPPYSKVFTDGKEYTLGKIYTVKYEVRVGEKAEEVHVQTTRPETIFADAALCANPGDKRYSHLKGGTAINPLTKKEMRFLLDEAAETEFGTGLLKITPAHDHVDFEVGLRHGLEMVSVLDKNNRMTVGPFKGDLRFDAREKTVKLLQEMNLLVSEEGHPSSIPVCSRTGEVVEPLLAPQWWMNCRELAKKALEASEKGELKIFPEEMRKTWNNWLENVRDWCLSRQLWWGHRIPAYERDGKWFIARTRKEAEEKAGGEVVQEEDVLDTWFSSGLWPFSTLGWPESSEDFRKFYPASLLETGRDIVFFWVARMVMMGIALTGKCPFSAVLFHSIVRDAKGEKMSKSKGNVIDPVDVISGTSLEELLQKLRAGNLSREEVERAEESISQEYPEGIEACGSDALRYALLSSASLGRDVNLSVEKVASCRRLCNKMWNAMKYVLAQKGDGSTRRKDSLAEEADAWIAGKFLETAESVSAALEEYNFMKAAVDVQQFLIYEFCDFYLEMFKGRRDAEGVENIRRISLEFVKLVHPFFPFLSEEVYHVMKGSWGEEEIPGYVWMPSVTVEEYPHGKSLKMSGDGERMERVLEFIRGVRSRASGRSESKRVFVRKSPESEILEGSADVIGRLVGLPVEMCEGDRPGMESSGGIEYALE
ncbi:valyl-tRNA synthetase [Nematocida major]|uniref:valyl-tRNA synthetase n=1 Tax=Nematocida major TaxID=1912982 RepID=UPI0020086D4C|nr:valyl-tRNA synthetase [Nematocida major]KAH9386945.1 valyl-tRNA synthetase [Nematocida major]